MIVVRNRRGFTLIEMIVASIILCVAVLALSSVCVRVLGEMRLNRQYNAAMELAEKQLVMIDYIGIEKFMEAGQMQGAAKNEELPGCRWKVSAESIMPAGLYNVKIVINWEEKGKSYQVAVETRFNGTSNFPKAVKL